MKKTVLCIGLMTVCFVCSCFSLRIDALDVSARSAVLIDAASGIVMYEKNADERLPMASTTKIMTALVALENAELDTVVEVPSAAVGIEGSSVCLQNGEKMKLGELLYAMMLESANDAAAAVAITVGGSIEDFARMMNEKAQSLGLVNTSFANPHGLDADGHYTTARELASIASEALKNADFAEMVSTYRKNIPTDGGYRYLMNHNKMLKLYDGAIGVKTGFTKKSGRCLVSAATRDGMTLVAVTLNAPDDWRDHTDLLDYGFENYEVRKLAEVGEYEFELSQIGKEIGTVRVNNHDAVSVCLKKTSGEISKTVYLPRMLWSSVESGEMLGRIEFALDGSVVATLPLCAE